MLVRLNSLLVKLWHDDGGAVLSTEYMMLGTIVALGGASGLSALSDATNAEMREFGQAVRSVRQSYHVPTMQTKMAYKAGSAAVDTAPSDSLLANP